MALTIKNVIF
jgi:histone chaperone ASF1